MPFVTPTMTFAPPVAQSGVVAVARRPTATLPGRLDCSFAAIAPFGAATSLCSVGANAGTAPAGSQVISVVANATTFENALAEAAPFAGWAGASARFRIFVEEFGPGVAGFAGPSSTIFDVSGFFSIRLNEVHGVTATFVRAVVPGRFYRIWADLVQSASCGGIASGVSNCTLSVSPLFFAFG